MTLAVVGLVAAGLILSATSALLWSGAQSSDQRQTLRTTAQNVTATLATLAGRDADFLATLRTVLVLNPHLSGDRFRLWYAELDASQRQVAGLGSAVLNIVPSDRLLAFEAGHNADPAYLAMMHHGLAIIPRPGARYCLLGALGVSASLPAEVTGLIQQNWCDPTSAIGRFEAHELDAAAGAGSMLVVPVALGAVRTTIFEMPFYRRGVALRTAAERRSAVLGWTISSFDTSRLVAEAIGHNKGLGVTLVFRNPDGRQVVMATGGIHSGPLVMRTSMNVDGEWAIIVRGGLGGTSIPAGVQGLLIFAIGAVMTMLVSLLILTLSRSRERALFMVAQKTGQLRHQALHDSLTGLPNRVLAIDRAEQMLARARRAREAIAVLYIDIDGFKHINDTFGHAAGDAFLRHVAARLETVVRESDTAARLAGDEFIVLLDTITLDAGPELVAERVLDVLREPYDLSEEIGRELQLTASIGVAFGLEGSAEDLLADADVALYAAKDAGRNRYAMFESGMHAAAQDRVALEMDLADALNGDELFLVYQPTFDLRSERATGVEALARWRHPTRGIVGPDVFIPVAERSGLILAIGRWVLHTACRQAARWHAEGHDLSIAVNVSGRQLDHDDLISDVRDALAAADMDPARLTIEITETALMSDPEATARRLAELKEIGVRVAIDDFGTGYSSLAYLRQFPVDTIKIDRAFVNGIATSKEQAALIHTLIDLGKTLNLETLGEGIEDLAQLQELQRVHCDSGQGFLFARPLDADGLSEFLSSRQPAAGAPAGADA
ncbi:MAG: bifunctional diguanylate cyclase/phosphodiesterase [Solirubrobacteraceae bacterium]